jgi:predicted nuclease of predicted toxin-antitoxin system
LQPRFLIDENLSVALAEAAYTRGFDAMHVVHLDLASERDWDLLTVVRDGDWALVTNNAVEFHRRHARLAIRAGVVFIRPSVVLPSREIN